MSLVYPVTLLRYRGGDVSYLLGYDSPSPTGEDGTLGGPYSRSPVSSRPRRRWAFVHTSNPTSVPRPLLLFYYHFRSFTHPGVPHVSHQHTPPTRPYPDLPIQPVPFESCLWNLVCGTRNLTQDVLSVSPLPLRRLRVIYTFTLPLSYKIFCEGTAPPRPRPTLY